jgi:hypothetical protein
LTTNTAQVWVNAKIIEPFDEKTSLIERENAFKALNGILSGHGVDLDKERDERILSR